MAGPTAHQTAHFSTDDAELARLIDRWPTLATAKRRVIMGIIDG